MSAGDQPGPRIFVSYAHKDAEFQGELASHLAALEKTHTAVHWCDGMIPPGEEWRDVLDEEMDKADVFLLLLSADFLASSYCNREMARALERQETGRTVLIPVWIRDCDLTGTPVEKMQHIPRDPPISQSRDRDAAYKAVVLAVRTALRAREQPGTVRSSARPVPSLLPYLPDRSSQTGKVADVLLQQPSDGGTPLVFVLGGPESERHDMFLRRICEETIPDVLGPKAQTSPIPVSWPPADSDNRLDHFRREALKRLANGPERRSSDGQRDPLQAMRAALAGLRAVVFTTVIHSYQMSSSEIDFLRSWVSAWKEVREPRGGPFTTVVVFVSVKYPNVETGRWLSWSTFRHRQRTARLGQALDDLKDLSGDGLRVIRLKDLEPVRREETIEWKNHEKLMAWLKERRSNEEFAVRIEAEINDLYSMARVSPDGGLSMEELGPRLRDVLQQYA